MALSERLFGRPAGAALALPAVSGRLAAAAQDGAGADPDLTRARLADALRDAGLVPPPPDESAAAVAGLDGEAGGRLAAFAAVLDVPDVRAALPKLLAGRPPLDLFAALAGVARDTPLLTADVLRQSELRVEELARRLVAGLGAAVAGETPAKSRQRLERIDYGRLLAEAERAKAAAAGRVDELRKRQEEQERARTRRGKW